MTRYVVRVEVRESPIRAFDGYLEAIRYDPYGRGDDRPATITTERSEAFVFQERAAAEMAAVWVGGRVEALA